MVSRNPAASPSIPLCVDLDGTLLRTDSLYESTLLLLKANPFWAVLLPIWLLGGKAALKREIASRVTLDPATLPYHPELLAYLREEHAKGRPLVLVSAAHETIVRAVARHLGIFRDVIASDGEQNLKGPNKRAILVSRFGEGGYDYAGDHPADLEVWSGARGAIVVSNDAGLARRAGSRVQRVFTSPRRSLATLPRAIRVQQWVKNLLVFVPLLMAPEARQLPLFLDTFLAFLAFSLCASSVYVTNDLLDLEADRRHVTKRYRPFAAGDLPLAIGLLLVPGCLLGAVLVTVLLPGAFAVVLLVYMIVTTAYSFRLKHVPLVDVIVLAMLYTGRVIAGAAATHVWPSPWILGFSLFFFLSLAFVKRYAEIYAMPTEQPALKVRGYYPADLELIATNGAVSGYISVLVAALYINSDRVVGLYAHPEMLWLICPLLLYWISRIWMLAHRGQLHDDPVLFAIKDRESWVIGALIALVLAAARL
jgi:4-hydroxybenzoate polyprenyltransferase